MDISQTVAELKNDPEFASNVGMILVHNGIVRASSRTDSRKVVGLEVFPDTETIEALRRECEQRPGIFRVVVQTAEGRLQPGDDLLLIIVAGDIRDNVKPALSDLLESIKARGVQKREIFA